MKRFLLLLLVSLLLLLAAQFNPQIPAKQAHTPTEKPKRQAKETIHPHLSLKQKRTPVTSPLALLSQHLSVIDASNYQPAEYDDFAPLTKRVLRRARYQQCRRLFRKQKNQFIRFRYKSGALAITAIMGLPTTWMPRRRFPVVIFNLGGRLGLSRFHACVGLMLTRLFVSQGYILVVPQYRGVGGSEGMEQFGGDDVTDLVRLARLLKKVSFVDPRNIFMAGGSRGGMMTYLALKQNVDINAAIVYAGTVDLYRTIADFAWFKSTVLQKLVPQFVQRPDAEIKRRSAMYWPHLIRKPVCIVQGGADRRVPFDVVRLFVEKLRQLGKKVTFLRYPNGTHHNIYRKSRRAVLSWLERQYIPGTKDAIQPQRKKREK